MRTPERIWGDPPQEIKPGVRVCAVCFWSHADVRYDGNSYHVSCLESLKKSWFPSPWQIPKKSVRSA